MFRNWNEKCKSSAIHQEHYRWNRDLNRLYCPGVYKYQWADEREAAELRYMDSMRPASKFPSIAHGLMSAVNDYNIDRPEPNHKHFYKIVDTLITPRGVAVDKSFIYWQCGCWDICMTHREEYKKETLRKAVYQTWPS